MKTEHNKKLPEIDAQKEKFEFTYPYFTCEQDDNGKYHFAFHDPNNPKNSTLIEMDHNGGYKATMPDDGASKGKGIHVSMTPGHTAHYTSGGSSNHTDGHTFHRHDRYSLEHHHNRKRRRLIRKATVGGIDNIAAITSVDIVWHREKLRGITRHSDFLSTHLIFSSYTP